MAAFDTSAPLLPEILSLHGKWKDSKPALVCEEQVVSWHQFEDNTNRIANALIETGISRGAMVGVVMSNGIAMVEVLVGIMKSGACSVPINLSVSDEALEAMLNDADISALFCTTDQQTRLQPYLKSHPDVLTVSDTALAAFSKDADTNLPAPGLTGDDPLNVIYSSGTTGMPKGILHVHQGRRDWAYDLAIALRYHSAAKTLFTIGLYSNISWVGMLCTLLSGGTMVIAPKFDAHDVLQTIQDRGITHFAMVPIQYQRLMEVPGQADFDLSSIEAVMSCGSPLHATLKETLFKRLGPKAVIELFGLTEGVITTLDPEDAEGRMASVGKPLIGTDIKIIGDDDREVPPGQSGEIVGCGRIVMPGYLNRPDATIEATWTDETGKGWLRTGDIGQLDDQGYLYIVDRKKDMILSGGQNIYPQDIEAVLIKHEAVNDVAVIGIPSERWGETPLAIVVPEAGSNLDSVALANWANALLGRQQRISGVTLTDALPRNPNGKILKRELRKIYGGN
ncbi:class I adenylate-forming enzyme family protein [Kordiimonas aestuarii]|uniref:class I adenylate-forming enzyme family protein n=1 Tax=Kordiimonas aestuarii TaxID=1005925 RepID=UPI0021CEC07C|nr:AMP-binding protein [Kordiimonas aestuarii]